MDFYEIFLGLLKSDPIAKKLSISNIIVVIKKEILYEIVESKIGEKYEEIVSNFTNNVKKTPLVINSGWIKSSGESIMVSITYNQYLGHFVLENIPTWTEVENAAKLLNDSINEQIVRKVRNLTQPQSEILIQNVLTFEDLIWIKDFKLNPTRNDDGGKDFTASILIRENKTDIGFNGYGRMTPCIGQLKHLRKEMGPGDMRDFVGTMRNSRMQYGIVISTNGYTPKALNEVTKSGYKIFCFDAKDIAKLIVDSKIGIKSIRIKTGIVPDEEWWNDIHLPS